MCASPLGYRIAEQFGHNIWPTSAGLVPFTLQPDDKDRLAPLSGISVDSIVSNERINFRENILFTHRGLSGPAILQISSYWLPGEAVIINLLPDIDLVKLLSRKRDVSPNTRLKNVLAELLPKKLLPVFLQPLTLDKPLQEFSQQRLHEIAKQLQQWEVRPNGTEGYRTAEVTLGGVDCDELSSKTMESKKVKGLYFIGEVVDVTGWLGGYNFQWAWSSGWCAGQAV
jgi:predicted Rossmann fold flavoprotein